MINIVNMQMILTMKQREKQQKNIVHMCKLCSVYTFNKNTIDFSIIKKEGDKNKSSFIRNKLRFV